MVNSQSGLEIESADRLVTYSRWILANGAQRRNDARLRGSATIDIARGLKRRAGDHGRVTT